MFRITLLTLALTAFRAGALPLAPIPDAPSDRLSIGKPGPNYACDEIMDKLITYNEMARAHDSSVKNFLDQVVSRLNGWYSELSALEGQTQTLPSGTFLPVQEGAAQIANVSALATDNTELLANEMSRIILSLEQCNLSSASLNKR